MYKLELLGVKEFSWDKGGTVRAGDYIFPVEKEKKILNWEQDFLYNTEEYQQLTVSVSDRMSCTILKCRWCYIIVLIATQNVRRKVMIHKRNFMQNYNRY